MRPFLTATITAVSILALAGSPAAFARPSLAAWTDPIPDTAAGRCARAFLEASNAGTSEAIRAFEEMYAGKERQARRPLEERVERLKALAEEWGKLTVESVLPADENSLWMKITPEHGEALVIQLQFSDVSAGKLDGMRISPASMTALPVNLSSDSRKAIVEGACKALENEYVYPEVAKKMTAKVREKMNAGGYDSIKDDAGLATVLTDDFRSVSNDRHLGVRLSPRQAPQHADQGPDAEQMRRENFAFRKVELLPGNIGYLRFDMFINTPDAEKTAAAAMNFLANSDAIIFDLRSNGGGDPNMIRFITSYLFTQPTHLNDMFDREGAKIEEYWTVADVPGQRPREGVPVYVLTSGRTFSGAEEFSYNLKNLKRATIVGERTGGGAHPVKGVPISERVVIGVPFLRANNPITKTNWEGTGVEPDVAVSADQALDAAIARARGDIASQRASK